MQQVLGGIAMTLTTVVSIGNVNDAEAFVRHCMKKAKIVLTEHEREDLIAEGLAILVELHQRYEPARDPGGQTGQTKGFYGYALYLLPKKLGDAWHRSNPHHVLRTQPDGTRKYEYLEQPKSMTELFSSELMGSDGHSIGPPAGAEKHWRTPGDFVKAAA